MTDEQQIIEIAKLPNNQDKTGKRSSRRLHGVVKQPFRIGQKIVNIYSGEAGKVTKHTKRGFKYKLDRVVSMNPFMWYQTGECFVEGFPHWKAA